MQKKEKKVNSFHILPIRSCQVARSEFGHRECGTAAKDLFSLQTACHVREEEEEKEAEEEEGEGGVEVEKIGGRR
jgi:hypothetical protein